MLTMCDTHWTTYDYEDGLKITSWKKATENVKHFLGFDINQDENGNIFVNQESFIQNILKLFEMDKSKTITTPIQANVEPMTKGDGGELHDKKLYQSIIGSLMYLSNGSRPDIAYAVGRLASRMSQPMKRNLTQAKGVLRYLKCMSKMGLTYKTKDNTKDLTITGFSDASFATGSKGKSVDGYIVYANGMPLSFRSGQQSTIALSTTESEYVAAVGCAK